jgi:hypothetical protein
MSKIDELDQLKDAFTTHQNRVSRSIRELNISFLAWHDLLVRYEKELPQEFNMSGGQVHRMQIECSGNLKESMDDVRNDITQIIDACTDALKKANDDNENG